MQKGTAKTNFSQFTNFFQVQVLLMNIMYPFMPNDLNNIQKAINLEH